MRFNPIKHKLMSRVSERPYSSFHADVRRGLLPADWAGDVDEPMMDFGERRGDYMLVRCVVALLRRGA